MKKLLLVGLLMLFGVVAFAQTPRTDMLHKIDRQTVEVKIDELTDTEIIYTEPGAPSVKKKIARSQVWKVVFGDGSTEMITPVATVGNTDGAGQADQITLLDNTTVSGKVTRRDDRKLYYTKPESPNGPPYELLLGRLDKITYADGREEVFGKGVGGTSGKTLAGTSAAPTKPARQPKAKKSKPAAYQAPAELASYKNPEAFERLQVTVGPEFSYYADFLNKDRAWLNDSTGFGMKQNVGASLRIDYRVLKPVAISITAGYFGWELYRRYTLNGLDEYAETQRLTQIPVQLGIKLYPFGGFYIMPEGGVDLMFASVKTSETHPTPANESITASPVTYGASIGTQISANKLLFDLSLRYQIVNVNNLTYQTFSHNLTESLNVASIRLGIGFKTLKK